MICPYCSRELEDGVIQSPQEISWSRKPHFFGASFLHDDSVLLAPLTLFPSPRVTAWLCRECKKVIIEYDEEDELVCK